MSKLAWLGQLTQSHTLCPKEVLTWHVRVLAPGWGSFSRALLPLHLLGPKVGILRASASQPWEGPNPHWGAGSLSPISTHNQHCAQRPQI